MLQIHQTQNVLLQNIMSQAWLAFRSRNLILSGSEVLNVGSSIAHSMFHFIFMNIGHLIGIHKQKIKFLADVSNYNTLFICFCETFLHEGIGDCEVQIHDFFSIIRCGVYIYFRKYINFTTYVNYSNSVCELMILKLHSPSLIIILMYRPPSCAINEFDNIIDKVNQFILSLSSPLPNIIILGDFYFLRVDWSSPNHPSPSQPLVNPCASFFFIFFLKVHIDGEIPKASNSKFLKNHFLIEINT